MVTENQICDRYYYRTSQCRDRCDSRNKKSKKPDRKPDKQKSGTQNKKYSGGRYDPFTALKAEPKRKKMPGQHKKRRKCSPDIYIQPAGGKHRI